MKANSFTIIFAPAISLATCVQAASGQEQKRFHFDLPPMELRTALKIVAKQANHQLVADAAAIRGKRSHALVGDYSVAEAIAILMDGLELDFEIRYQTVIVRARRPSPNTV